MQEQRSLLRHMCSVKWLSLLALALVLAGAFVALSHWQLSRSIATAQFAHSRDTETVRPLNTALQPGAPMHDNSEHVMVRTKVTPIPGTLRIIRDRKGNDGPVYWVTGAANVVQPDGTKAVLAVVWGQSVDLPNLDTVGANLGGTRSLVGRLYVSEAPQPELDADRLPNVVSVPQLVGQWDTPTGVQDYSGFVIDKHASGNLSAVPIPAPEKTLERNMLNVFYAIEWVFFAGFALFLWGRLAVDDYRRAQEYAALALAEAEANTKENVS